MKQFFLNLLNGENSTSSKRFAGLTTLAAVLLLAFIASYKNNGQCPEFMYDGLLILVGGLFGLNAAENIMRKTKPKTDDPIPDVTIIETPIEETPEEVIVDPKKV